MGAKVKVVLLGAGRCMTPASGSDVIERGGSFFVTEEQYETMKDLTGVDRRGAPCPMYERAESQEPESDAGAVLSVEEDKPLDVDVPEDLAAHIAGAHDGDSADGEEGADEGSPEGGNDGDDPTNTPTPPKKKDPAETKSEATATAARVSRSRTSGKTK